MNDSLKATAARYSFWIAPLLAGALTAHAEPAKGPRVLVLKAGEAPPRIDGRLDEAVWQRAPVHASFVQHQPVAGPAPAGLRTTVQLLVDEQALVFGIRAWDAQPDRLQSGLTRRDQVKRDQDFVGVWLDPTGRRRAAQFVRVGLGGSIGDGMYRADDDEEDYGPDFPVQAAVQRLPDGYSVELRWPLASLRYPYADGLPWRVMVARSVPHADGALLVSAPLSKDDLHFIAQLQVIEGLDEVLSRVRDQSFISLQPELTLRRQRLDREAGRSERSSSTSLGLALKWRPRADWVMDALLNPDFAQLELDVPPSTGASRLAQELPEKRGYFLESADVLGLPLPAFYSRSISDPRWGLRATWRGAEADATVLQLQDRAGAPLLRGSPFATLSYSLSAPSAVSLWRGRWHGEPLAIGALLSQRDHGAGRYNRVLGADGHWHLHHDDDQHQLRWALLASSTSAAYADDGRPLRVQPRPGQFAWLEWRQRSASWHQRAELSRISPDFAHDNGFLAQAGVQRGLWELNRRLGEGPVMLGSWALPVHELEAHLTLQETRSLADARRAQVGGELVDRKLQPGFWFAGPRRLDLWLNYGLDEQRARSGGRMHRVPAWHGGFMASPWPWLTQLSAEFSLGRQLDAEADRTGPGGNTWLDARTRWPLPLGMSLESDHRWARAWVRSPAGGPSFVDSSWRWMAMWHLDAARTLRFTAQGTRSQRETEAGLELAGWRQQRQHRSIVWQQRLTPGRSWAIGWVREEVPRPWSADEGRDGELFFKLQWSAGS